MPRIDYICFSNLTGYAAAAYNYLRALATSPDYDIKVTPVDFGLRNQFPADRENFYKPLIKKKHDPNRIHIFHCIPDMHRRFKPAAKTIGIGVYETTNPPAHWIAILNKNDAVLVPSEFNRREFVKAGVTKPVVLVPHCLDMDKYKPDVHPFDRSTSWKFLFIGSWRKRKGFHTLLEAWANTFQPDEPVELVIKTDKTHMAKTALRKLSKKRQLAPVLLDKERYSEDEMARFIRSSDCLVAPSMGEGFGLPALQAMALGITTIVTDYSGPQDYATAETAFLLEPAEFVFEKCLDGIPQFSKKTWAYISPTALGSVMRYVYEHPHEARKKAQVARLYVKNHFSYNAALNGFDKLFSSLY